jgi:hypothetical protein
VSLYGVPVRVGVWLVLVITQGKGDYTG